MIKMCRVLRFVNNVHACRVLGLVIGLINVCLEVEMFHIYMRLERRPEAQRLNLQNQTC